MNESSVEQPDDKEEKESEKLVLKDMLKKQLKITLKELPNQQLEDSQEEVVLKEFPLSSMMTLELYLNLSWNQLLKTQLLIPSMPEEKLSLHWM